MMRHSDDFDGRRVSIDQCEGVLIGEHAATAAVLPDRKPLGRFNHRPKRLFEGKKKAMCREGASLGIPFPCMFDACQRLRMPVRLTRSHGRAAP